MIDGLKLSGGEDQSQYAEQSWREDIFESKSVVKRALRTVAEMRALGEISQQQSRTMLRRAVEEYLFETKWLMQQRESLLDDSEPSYWSDFEIGVQQLPDGSQVEFIGLQDFDRAPEMLEFQTTKTTRDGLVGNKTKRVVKSVQLDRSISLAAYDGINAFLTDIGLAPRFEEDRRDAGFDYEDILEEGPPKGDASQLKADGSGNEAGNDE